MVDRSKGYLIKNAYKPGNIDDFYAGLSMPAEFSLRGVSAKDFMQRWLLQENYPLIDIKLFNVNDAQSRIDFRQSRFLYSVVDANSQTRTSPFK